MFVQPVPITSVSTETETPAVETFAAIHVIIFLFSASLQGQNREGVRRQFGEISKDFFRKG